MRSDAHLSLVTTDDTKPPTLGGVWLTDTGPRCTISLGPAGTLYAEPRILRAFAEQLLDLADQACRREDELTDKTQTDINRAGLADTRASLHTRANLHTRAEHDEQRGRDHQLAEQDGVR